MIHFLDEGVGATTTHLDVHPFFFGELLVLSHEDLFRHRG